MPELSERLRKKAADGRIPITAAFEISPVCNFNCSMCYVRKSNSEVESEGGLLSAKAWLAIMAQGKEHGLLYPLITGGEPFLYPEFEQIYRGIHEMGMMLSMNSNGSLITEAVGKWLAKQPPMRINITLYGASAGSYEALTGDARGFEKAIRGIEVLKKYGLRFAFNTSITPANCAELKEIITLGKEYDVPVRVATYMFAPVRREDKEAVRLTPEEAGRAKVLADYELLPEQEFARAAHFFDAFVPLEQIDFANLAPGPGRGTRCYAGRNTYWVDWQGNMSACGIINQPKYNLREYSFAEAWNKIVSYADTVRYAHTCNACPNFAICNPCQAVIGSENGMLDGRPEYHCRMMNAAAKYYREHLKINIEK